MKNQFISLIVILLSITLFGCGTSSHTKRYNKAVSHIQNKNYLPAIEELKTIVKENPTDAEAHDLLGKCYTYIDENNLAVREFEEALKLDSDNISYSNHLGVTYATSKNREKAMEQFKYSLSLDPENLDAHYYIGKLKYQVGDIEGARESWRKCLSIDPDNVRAAEALDSTRHYDKSKKKK